MGPPHRQPIRRQRDVAVQTGVDLPDLAGPGAQSAQTHRPRVGEPHVSGVMIDLDPMSAGVNAWGIGMFVRQKRILGHRRRLGYPE